MKAVVFYKSGPDVMTLAPLHYPAHKARIDTFSGKGELLAVGTWSDPREGALAIFGSRAAAEEFVREDPFVVEGVVTSFEIRDWNEILLP